MGTSAYGDAVALLARRDLSEVQLRERLARRRHAPGAIDEAVARLREAGVLDDRRTAAALARVEVLTRHRGPERARLKLAAAGIPADIAGAAVSAVLREVDLDAMLGQAIRRRLAGRTVIANEREFARLYRHFVAQGYAAGQVMAALRGLFSGR